MTIKGFKVNCNVTVNVGFEIEEMTMDRHDYDALIELENATYKNRMESRAYKDDRNDKRDGYNSPLNNTAMDAIRSEITKQVTEQIRQQFSQEDTQQFSQEVQKSVSE